MERRFEAVKLRHLESQTFALFDFVLCQVFLDSGIFCLVEERESFSLAHLLHLRVILSQSAGALTCKLCLLLMFLLQQTVKRLVGVGGCAVGFHTCLGCLQIEGACLSELVLDSGLVLCQ